MTSIMTSINGVDIIEAEHAAAVEFLEGTTNTQM